MKFREIKVRHTVFVPRKNEKPEALYFVSKKCALHYVKTHKNAKYIGTETL